MQNKEFVQNIWNGEITATLNDGSNPLDRLLKPLLPVNTVCLSMKDCKQTLVWSDRKEVMPGITVGDLISEEMNIDVPYGTMVIIHDSNLPLASMEEASYAVGRIVGAALVFAACSAKVGVARENEALYIMSVCYSEIVQSEFLRSIGLGIEHFHLGLGSALRAFWIGTDSGASDRSGIFLNWQFLNTGQLLNFLRNLDPTFTPPKRGRIKSAMILLPNSGGVSFQEWQTIVAIRAADVVKEAGKSLEAPKWSALMPQFSQPQ
jgi:hypothetical protein